MENQALSGGVSTILRSGLILKNIQRMLLLPIWVIRTMYMNFDEKHSPKVLKNQTRLQNSTDTIRKSLIFHVLCALFEKIPSDINRDSLKNPTWSGAKNSNKLCAPSHLVTWIPHCESPWQLCGQAVIRTCDPWSVIRHVTECTMEPIKKKIP